jgi:hypothetical protein
VLNESCLWRKNGCFFVWIADFAYKELKLTKAATIHDGSPYAEQLQAVFAAQFKKLGGTITAQEAISPDDTDMRPVLTKIATGKPEFLYLPIFIAAGGHNRRHGVCVSEGCRPGKPTHESEWFAFEPEDHGVGGGFCPVWEPSPGTAWHLLSASEERIGRTAEALSQFDIELISAGHCTGFKAQAALYQTFKDRFKPLQTGMTFEI